MYVLGKSSELYKPTSEDLINPIYDISTISYGRSKKSVKQPKSNYDDVNRYPEVKMTSNPAYAVP